MIDSSQSKISIVVPCGFGDSYSPFSLEQLTTQLSLLGNDFEIVLIGEENREIASSLEKFTDQRKRVKIYHSTPSYSKGHLSLAGLNYTEGDPIILVDCDLSSAGKKIRIALAHFEQEEADVATYRSPNRQAGPSLASTFYDPFYKILTNFLFKVPYSPQPPEILVLRRQVLEKIGSLSSNPLWQLELILAAKNLGFDRIIEVPATPEYQYLDKPGAGSFKEVLGETLAIFGQKVTKA